MARRSYQFLKRLQLFLVVINPGYGPECPVGDGGALGGFGQVQEMVLVSRVRFWVRFPGERAMLSRYQQLTKKGN